MSLVIEYGNDGNGDFDKTPLEEGVPYKSIVKKIEPRERGKYGEPGEKEDVYMITFEVTQEGDHKGDWASGFAGLRHRRVLTLRD